MTNEQKVRVDRLERYLIADKDKIYTRVRVDDLDTVLSLIKQKDKQIDLMAEYMSKQDIEEDICMQNKTNPDLCNENYTNCKNCIKQYFADLVEKE